MSDEKPPIEDPVVVRDEKGRLVKGSQLGALGRGVPRPGHKSLRKESKALAQEMLQEALPELMKALVAKAGTADVRSLQLALKHSLPTPRPETFLDGMEEGANLDPTSRTEWANRQAMLGRISLEAAAEIGKAAVLESEAQILRTVKAISRDMKNGLPPEKALLRLHNLAEEVETKHTPVQIEHQEEGADA